MPSGTDRLEYAGRMMNLVPFKTISLYVRSLRKGNLFRISVANLLGNLFLIMPVGFMLPVLFEKMKKLHVCLIFCLLMLIVIEILQLITMRGSFDVDDLILNMTGALIGFVIQKIIYIIIAKKNRKAADSND